jgi:PIN domain nuclease of toxin-antitoxin system
LLLDTNALLWSLLEQQRLSASVADAIAYEANEIFVSVISVWEIEIKRAKGRLHVPLEIESTLNAQRFGTLPVTLQHVQAVESLPRHHRDPFDRMLIAQAQLEGLTLVTSDRAMRRYPISVLPAI